jgi:hypothetical protein
MNCIMRKVNLVGAGAASVLPHLLLLAAWLGLAYGWGYMAFKQWVRAQRGESREIPKTMSC